MVIYQCLTSRCTIVVLKACTFSNQIWAFMYSMCRAQRICSNLNKRCLVYYWIYFNCHGSGFSFAWLLRTSRRQSLYYILPYRTCWVGFLNYLICAEEIYNDTRSYLYSFKIGILTIVLGSNRSTVRQVNPLIIPCIFSCL